jgi:hypothetical protein
MRWCDPCASDPLSNEELRQLGVFWSDRSGTAAMPRTPLPRLAVGGPADVFVTRLHVRYDNAHFPEDLVFQETADRSNFQGRYVLRHGWSGTASCQAATDYRVNLRQRQEDEAQQLSSLTGWELAEIRKRMNLSASAEVQPAAATWWQRLWRK